MSQYFLEICESSLLEDPLITIETKCPLNINIGEELCYVKNDMLNLHEHFAKERNTKQSNLKIVVVDKGHFLNQQLTSISVFTTRIAIQVSQPYNL